MTGGRVNGLSKMLSGKHQVENVVTEGNFVDGPLLNDLGTVLLTPLHRGPASVFRREQRVLSLRAPQPRVFPSVPVVAQESLTSGLHNRRSGQRRLVLHGSELDRGP